MRIGIGEIMQLQPFEQMRGAVLPNEHAGNDDECRAVLRNALLELEAGQQARRHEARSDIVGQRHCRLAGRDEHGEGDKQTHGPARRRCKGKYDGDRTGRQRKQ